jgi:hypothetical protein
MMKASTLCFTALLFLSSPLVWAKVRDILAGCLPPGRTTLARVSLFRACLALFSTVSEAREPESLIK